MWMPKFRTWVTFVPSSSINNQYLIHITIHLQRIQAKMSRTITIEEAAQHNKKGYVYLLFISLPALYHLFVLVSQQKQKCNMKTVTKR